MFSYHLVALAMGILAVREATSIIAHGLLFGRYVYQPERLPIGLKIFMALFHGALAVGLVLLLKSLHFPEKETEVAGKAALMLAVYWLLDSTRTEDRQ